MDGVNTTITGGWLDHNWKQLYIQFAYICACCAYVFFVTAGLAKALSYIPWLGLRASERAEIIGMDEDQVRFASYLPVRWLIIHDSHSSASLPKISLRPGGTSVPGLAAIRPPILWARRWPMGISPLQVTATACPTLRRVDMLFTRRSLNYLREMVKIRMLARRSPSRLVSPRHRSPSIRLKKLNGQPPIWVSQGIRLFSTPPAPILVTRSVSKSVSSCCGSSVVAPVDSSFALSVCAHITHTAENIPNPLVHALLSVIFRLL